MTAVCEVGADVLIKLGLNVDYVSLDCVSIVQRNLRQPPPAKGGWNVFAALTGGLDWRNPACNAGLRGNGRATTAGWPTVPPGLYRHPVAYRNDLTGLMKGLVLFAGVRRV